MILENLPIFLHRASNNGGFSGIKLIFSKANQYIPITCTDEITITYISGGVKKTDTYSGLSSTLVSIPCDANTQVVITGAVEDIDLSMQAYLISAKIKNTALTSLNCSNCPALATLDLSTNTALTYLNCYNCPALATLDLSTNTALTSLDCYNCPALATLDLSTNTALTSLDCSSCPALATLDLSTNTALTYLNCSNCPALVSISYPATNEDVSTAIAGAITDADAADGTVYTDSAAAYYSTIATAATTKGWTIEQIAA